MTLAEKLDEAERAYHDLITGNKPTVLVDQSGERIEYALANRGALAAYVASLRQQIAATKPSPFIQVNTRKENPDA